ncbi:hypothetical protein [Senegalia massiliensis]|uniref:Uncharacterized protein n=1 Tax=Senegalia massiliensis TaxID=1720316 RepID=A0A845QYN3_9CLOT|nr:hypothetical protein [Senegalia massiliensis]NBI07595.1 hypothetical protein [Senegalia massiliensis]
MNKKKIVSTVLLIIFLLVIIDIIITDIRDNKKVSKEEKTISTTNKATDINKKEIPKEIEDFNAAIFYEFLTKLNNKEFNKAFDMISQKKKSEKYSIEKMKEEFSVTDGYELTYSILNIEENKNYYHNTILLINLEDMDHSYTTEIEVFIYKDKTIYPHKMKKIDMIEEEIKKVNSPIKAIDDETIGELNKDFIIDSNDIDKVSKKLNMSIDLINTIKEDFSKDKINKENYYRQNEGILFDIFGIKSLSEFEQFYNKLTPIDKVINATIEVDGNRITDNIIVTDLYVKSKEEKVKMELKIIVEEVKNKKYYLIFIE